MRMRQAFSRTKCPISTPPRGLLRLLPPASLVEMSLQKLSTAARRIAAHSLPTVCQRISPRRLASQATKPNAPISSHQDMSKACSSATPRPGPPETKKISHSAPSIRTNVSLFRSNSRKTQALGPLQWLLLLNNSSILYFHKGIPLA